MTYEERVKSIKEHFNNITLEQLENNLDRAGMGRIKSLISEDMRLILPGEDAIYSCIQNQEWEIDDFFKYQEYSLCEVA
jgi:hypothetical protein